MLFIVSLVHAEEILRVSDFEVSVFSKVSKEPVAIIASVIFEGRDVEIYDFKIIDALNVVIGSFYAEDLLTSKGKLGLKQGLITYAVKEYAIDIDHIYIQKLKIIDSASTDDIIEALRKEGLFDK